jgi:predicted small lipoprotein YifL
MSVFRLVSIALLAALITACGQKGPLILPDDAKPAQTSNGKAVSTKPAADKQLDGDALAGKPLSGKALKTKPLSGKTIDTKPMSTKPYNVE